MIRNNFYFRRSHVRIAGFGLLLVCGVSAYLLLIGELVAVVAWWFIIGIFSPILFLASRVKSFVLHMFIGVAFVTQIVTVPVFVINRDLYEYSGYNAVKSFSFTVSEFASIYSLIAFFLAVVVCCVACLLMVFPLPQHSLGPDLVKSTLPFFRHGKKRKARFYLTLLIVAVVFLLPLNLWMFRKGISLVGIEPPELPYRLVGILHYFTRFVVPFALGAIYAKTSRSYAPACVLLAYGSVLGASHISRFSVVLAIIPVAYFAFLDRRHMLMAVSVIYGLASIQLVTLLRNVVYVIGEGRVRSETTIGLVQSFLAVVGSQLGHFSIVETIVSMVGRVDAAQDIVLSYQFNPDAVGGVLAAFERFFYQGWVTIDLDTYHLEWIGTTLPEGFVSAGGGLLSACLAITRSRMLYMALFGVIVGVFIVFGEGLARAIAVKYKVPAYYYVVGGVYIVFFYIGSGTSVFLGMVAILIIALATPRYTRGFVRYGRLNI